MSETNNGIGKIFGTWPGDETDGQLLAALSEVRKPATPEVRGKASPESPEEAFRRGQLVVLDYVATNFDNQIDWASPLGSLRNCPPFPYIAPTHIEGKG